MYKIEEITNLPFNNGGILNFNYDEEKGTLQLLLRLDISSKTKNDLTKFLPDKSSFVGEQYLIITFNKVQSFSIPLYYDFKLPKNCFNRISKAKINQAIFSFKIIDDSLNNKGELVISGNMKDSFYDDYKLTEKDNLYQPVEGYSFILVSSEFELEFLNKDNIVFPSKESLSSLNLPFDETNESSNKGSLMMSQDYKYPLEALESFPFHDGIIENVIFNKKERTVSFLFSNSCWPNDSWQEVEKAFRGLIKKEDYKSMDVKRFVITFFNVSKFSLPRYINFYLQEKCYNRIPVCPITTQVFSFEVMDAYIDKNNGEFIISTEISDSFYLDYSFSELTKREEPVEGYSFILSADGFSLEECNNSND